jgi:CheY-like chemotaxis protein
MEVPSDWPAATPAADELFARKGRASARGFGTGAVDEVAGDVARTARPLTAIRLASTQPEPARPRALIADGDALSRKLYRDLLEAEGYDVVVAVDGMEALQAVRREAPDVAVVNLRLAELSGFDVARRLNDGNGPGIPVLAVDEMYRPDGQADLGANVPRHRGPARGTEGSARGRLNPSGSRRPHRTCLTLRRQILGYAPRLISRGGRS